MFKKLLLIVILIASSTMMSGCLLRSINEFYTSSEVIQFNDFDNITWKHYDSDGKLDSHWKFDSTNSTLRRTENGTTTDELEVVFFKIRNVLYADVSVKDELREQLPYFVRLHMPATHSLHMVKQEPSQVRFIALSDDILDEASRDSYPAFKMINGDYGSGVTASSTAELQLLLRQIQRDPSLQPTAFLDEDDHFILVR